MEAFPPEQRLAAASRVELIQKLTQIVQHEAGDDVFFLFLLLPVRSRDFSGNRRRGRSYAKGYSVLKCRLILELMGHNIGICRLESRQEVLERASICYFRGRSALVGSDTEVGASPAEPTRARSLKEPGRLCQRLTLASKSDRK